MELVKKGKVWCVLDGDKEVYRGRVKPNLEDFKPAKKAAPKKKAAAKKSKSKEA